MSTKVIVGNSLAKVTKAVLKEIEISSSFELENFVVVPDRFSLFAEKQIFENLGINSSFNIKVLGISKLAKYFLSKQDLLSKDQSVLEIFLILKNANFVSFANPTLELAEEIFAIISQLKSSNITCEEFSEKASNQKLVDLANIFALYQSTKSKPDQSDLLFNLATYLDTEKVSKANFFFAGFDSLTEQGFKVLEKLIVNAKKVVVGATRPENQKNRSVYDEDILFKIEKIKKENKIEIEKVELNENIPDFSEHILKNLFAYSKNKMETNKVHLLEFETPTDELTEVAKTINFYVQNKEFRYKDFNILCGNLDEEKDRIENIFLARNVPVFFDVSTKVSSLPIFSFFKTIFEFLQTKDYTSLLCVLSNIYSEVSKEELSDFQNYVNAKGYFDFEFCSQFETIKILLEKLTRLDNELSHCVRINDFSKVLKNFYDEYLICEKTENVAEKLKQEDCKKEKVFVQIDDVFVATIKTLTNEYEIEKESYLDIFLKIFGDKEISSAGLSVDCVYVGSQKSFFERRKVLFVTSAKQGLIPQTTKDLGLLSDGDISKVSLPIQPTINMINKRNKQKLLFDLTLSEEIFVSFSENELGDKTEKSILFDELKKMFTHNGNELQILSKFNEKFVGDKLDKFNFQTQNDFDEFVVNLKSENKISQEDYINLVGEHSCLEEKISKAEELFGRKFSPTQIEKFYECPLKHFLLYGLRIKENSVGKFDGRDYGNFFHIYAKNFVNRNLKKLGSMNESDIESELAKIFEIIKQDERFGQLLINKENIHVFEVLKKEAKMLLSHIDYEQKYSNFFAKFVEKYFELAIDDFIVSGFVDRIDKSENYFRVIDYKSGETKRSLCAFYNGLELQLFLYLFAIREIYGYKPAGGFYMPIGGDFAKDKDTKKFVLDGFILKNYEVIKDLDRRFGNKFSSDIVSLKLAKSSTIKNFVLSTSKNTFSERGFESAFEYLKRLLKSFREEVMCGKISAVPTGDLACKNCPLYGICSFNQNLEQEPRQLGREISEEILIGIVENGERI